MSLNEVDFDSSQERLVKEYTSGFGLLNCVKNSTFVTNVGIFILTRETFCQYIPNPRKQVRSTKD